jgi:hypothetical protein
MPKTFNERQIARAKLEAEVEPHAAEAPDLTRYIQFFSAELVRELVGRIRARVAKGKPVHLTPQTAYLVARALEAWNAKPTRREIVREICGVPNCPNYDRCTKCIGQANAIIGLYEGRKVRE